jgi:hypothetical protein
MVPASPPSLLTTIVVPDAFHPSTFARLERCPLSVLGLHGADERALLVPHPTAFLGTILHHVRREVLEGRWGVATGPQQAAAASLAAAVDDVERALSSNAATRRLVPLYESVGRRTWKSRTRELDQWAASVVAEDRSENPRLLSIDPWRPSRGLVGPGRDATGFEKVFANRDLRLCGRPDWTGWSGQRCVDVVEFKSGRTTDVDGQLLAEHVVQVQLYALILEAAFPDALVRPFIERVDRVEVHWGREERALVKDRLRDVSTSLPSGATLDARDLSRPGIHCRSCRLRPICPGYASAAPSWWPEEPGNPRPLPMDVWGEVTSMRSQGEDWEVRLTDAAGRRVRIDGIDRRHGVGALKMGDSAWFFDLEPSEDLSQQGALVQPRNFHESPPGPRWRPARAARVFLKGS